MSSSVTLARATREYQERQSSMGIHMPGKGLHGIQVRDAHFLVSSHIHSGPHSHRTAQLEVIRCVCAAGVIHAAHKAVHARWWWPCQNRQPSV